MDIKLENKDLATYRHEISVPINARRFLLRGEAFKNKIGMFVTDGKMVTSDIKLNSFENDTYDSVINLAKDLNDKVQNVCVQNFQKTVDEVGLLNLLADKSMKNLDSIFKENPKKICDYELSNLGYTNRRHANVIKRLVFNQSFNPRSSNMTVACITGGFSGDCVLSFMTTNEEELCIWGDRFDKVLALFLSSTKNSSIRE
jgi:dsDNA-binding SOS-regulon protein